MKNVMHDAGVGQVYSGFFVLFLFHVDVCLLVELRMLANAAYTPHAIPSTTLLIKMFCRPSCSSLDKTHNTYKTRNFIHNI